VSVPHEHTSGAEARFFFLVLIGTTGSQDYLLDACTDTESTMPLLELGGDMSVCIAAISRQGAGDTREEIIAIADRKVSSGEFSNEDATTKSAWLDNDWLCLFAGNDISPAIPITTRATELMIGKENTLAIVTEAMEASYQEYLANLCRSQVLGRWKFASIEEFREKGRKQFGNDVFDSLVDRIDRVRVQCTFWWLDTIDMGPLIFLPLPTQVFLRIETFQATGQSATVHSLQ
jgi:hypothetical protein